MGHTPLFSLPDEDVYATRKKIDFVLEQLNAFEAEIGRPARILDFGCGNAEQMGKFVVGSERTYVGVDMHAASREHAQVICEAITNAKFVADIPTDQIFDVLIISEVLEHLDDPSTLLNQLVSQLEGHAIVLGSIPNGYGLTEIEKFVIHKTGLYWFARICYRAIKKILGKPVSEPETNSGLPYNHESGHVQFFTKTALIKVLQSANLEVTALQNGSVMGADLSGSTFLRGAYLIKQNTRLAQYLPNCMAATWHFAAQIKR